MRVLRSARRRPKTAILLVFALALTIVGVGYAAGWFSGASGSATGNLGTDTTAAVVITGTISGNPEPGQVGAVSYTWKNNATVTETIGYPQTYVVTTSDDGPPDNCSTHLTEGHSSLSPSTPATMTAGQQLTFTGGTLTADATTPVACKGKLVTITVTGTTTP